MSQPNSENSLKTLAPDKDIPGCQMPLQVGLRRTRSIRNLIVRADLTEPDAKVSSLPIGHYKCGRCKVFPSVMEG